MKARDKTFLVSLCLSLCACATASAGGPHTMPVELLGTWQYGYSRCAVSVFGESDSAIRIETTAIVGYESRDAIKSVRRISKSPNAWKILRISDTAPEEIQDRYEIFVQNGERLTMTDGESARTYTRCR